MLTALLFLGLISWGSSSEALVHLTGKQLHRGKVFGMGYSVTAKSLAQCMEACNLHNSTCDGVVFHQIIGKCRLLKKCAVAVQVDNSTSAVYYSKRPQIPSEGFLHLEPSDSCLGFQPALADYAESDRACHERSGRLALLKSARARSAASKLLIKNKQEWAWVGEYAPGNHVAGREVEAAPTNSTGNKCWAVSVNETWGQFPCKHHLLPALCQILPFPA